MSEYTEEAPGSVRCDLGGERSFDGTRHTLSDVCESCIDQTRRFCDGLFDAQNPGRVQPSETRALRDIGAMSPGLRPKWKSR